MLSLSLIIPSNEFAACVKIIVSYNQRKQQKNQSISQGSTNRIILYKTATYGSNYRFQKLNS
jgi:hypothetical protein